MNYYATTDVFIYIMGILSLILIIIYFYNQYKSINQSITGSTSTTSPNYTPCPDYWNTVGPNQCQNINQLGSCAIKDKTVMDFSDSVFNSSSTGNYAKCKWAKGCNVFWSGIDKLC